MKSRLSMTLLALLALFVAFEVRAQDTSNSAQTAENLRAQLRDVQLREAEFRSRLDELNWQLKPENIERHFAGVGSTRPEELRESRRRQLQSEKDAINAQLEQLATSRTRLEAAILATETQAYQQGTMGKASLLIHRVWGTHRLVVVTGVIMLGAMAGILMVALVIRRRWGQM